MAALIYVLSLRLLISALCAVQGAMLNRDMDFKTLTITNTWATVISGTLGIVMDLPEPLPAGDRSACTAPPHWVCFPERKASRRCPPCCFTERSVGVTFPLFSRMQEDRSALKARFRKVVRFTCLAHFPVMVLMAVTAPELVRGLLTAKWDACVPYLQVLCIAGLLYPLHAVNLSVIQASGDGALFLRLEIIRKIVLLGVLLVTFRHGVMAMTYGLVAHTMVTYALNVAGSRRDLGYDWEEQAHDILPFVFCALFAGGAAWIAGHAWGGSVWTLLAIKLVTGVICYAALLGLGRHRVFAGDLTMLYDFARQIGRMARRAA